MIAASIDPAILAARYATSSTPIAMNASDPIGLGLVSSLSRPGGNITGLTNQSNELIGKKFQVLLEVVPHARRVGMLVSGPSRLRDDAVANARAAAASRGVELHVVEATSAPALERAFPEPRS